MVHASSRRVLLDVMENQAFPDLMASQELMAKMVALVHQVHL